MKYSGHECTAKLDTVARDLRGQVPNAGSRRPRIFGFSANFGGRPDSKSRACVRPPPEGWGGCLGMGMPAVIDEGVSSLTSTAPSEAPGVTHTPSDKAAACVSVGRCLHRPAFTTRRRCTPTSRSFWARRACPAMAAARPRSSGSSAKATVSYSRRQTIRDRSALLARGRNPSSCICKHCAPSHASCRAPSSC
jgi:hypothetical protein